MSVTGGGGLEVDLGETTLHINSAGSIDINVRDSSMSPRSRASRGSRGSRGSRPDASLTSQNVDSFLKNQGFDPDAINDAAAFAAHDVEGDDRDSAADDGGDDDEYRKKSASLEERLDNLERLLEEETGSPMASPRASGTPTKQRTRETVSPHGSDSMMMSYSRSSEGLGSKGAMQEEEEEEDNSLERRMRHLDQLLHAQHQDIDQVEGVSVSSSSVGRSGSRNSSNNNGNPYTARAEDDLGNEQIEGTTGLPFRDDADGALSPQPRSEDENWSKGGPSFPTSTSRSAMAHASNDEADAWGRLNLALERAGFNAVPIAEAGTPDPLGLFAEVREILVQFERRGAMIQDLTMDSNAAQHVDDSTMQKLHRAQKEILRLQEEVKQRREENRQMREDNSLSQRGDTAQLRKLKHENAMLQQKLNLSEHRVKAKEAVLERLQAKLEAQAQLEASQKERSRDLFEDLEHRKPRPSSKTDQALLQAIHKFEEEKRTMEEEHELLNAEIRRLNDALQKRENELNGSEASSLDQMEREILRKSRTLEMDQAVAERALENRERAVVIKMQKLEGQLSEARRDKQALQDSVDNLKLELSSRPTMRDWKAAQANIAELEGKLTSAIEVLEDKEVEEARRNNIFVPRVRPDSATSPLGPHFPGQRPDASTQRQPSAARQVVEERAQRALQEQHDNRKRTSTASLIRRDKLNFRLGLSKVGDLPSSRAHDILQELCRLLEISDVEIIVPAVQKMIWIVRAMPKLERFAKDISAFVTLHGDATFAAAAEHPNPSTALQAVLPQLKRWMGDVRTVQVWRDFREQVLAELQKSSLLTLPKGDAQTLSLTNEQIVKCLRDLVTLERNTMDHDLACATADTFVKTNPELLVSRSVSHFKELFGVRTMDGVFPKMNELYVFANEMENFLKVLRPTLGLAARASVHACLARVQELALTRAPGAGGDDLAAASGAAFGGPENDGSGSDQEGDRQGVDHVVLSDKPRGVHSRPNAQPSEQAEKWFLPQWDNAD